MPEALVDIDKVRTEAIRIPLNDLRITDKVFDIFGNTYSLTYVRRLKDGTVKIRREDMGKGQWDYLYPFVSDTITVIRKDS